MTRLEYLRRARGMSQTTLAGLVGLYSYSAVSRWEHHLRRPYPRHAVKLEAIFGEPIESLLSPYDEGADNVDPSQNSRPAKAGALRGF